MAIYVNTVDGMTSYDAGDATNFETQFITDEGVVGVAADDLLVEAQTVPDMTVKANAGSCFVKRDAHNNNDNTLKFWNVIVTTDTNITISTADPSNPRIDIICVRIDTGATPDANASNVGSLVAVAGTPAASPSAPAVPSNYLKIAEVAVGAGVTVISSGNITDYRNFIGLQLPYANGYRLKDTGASLDAQFYEDSAGNVTLLSSKSGGGFRINPVSNKVQKRHKASEIWANIGPGEDGWQEANEQWVYATATTITVPAGATSKYQIGNKIRFKQGGAYKYFYIVGVSDTVLEVTGGSSYTLTNAVISDNYYSVAESPLGFPDWFSYTPVNTNIIVGNGVEEAMFCLKGKTGFLAYNLTWGSTTAFSGDIKIGLPIIGVNHTNTYLFLGPVHAQDAGTAANNALGVILLIKNTATAYIAKPDFSVYSATIPFTWASTDVLRVNVAYRIV